jgi:hypothetical protein
MSQWKLTVQVSPSAWLTTVIVSLQVDLGLFRRRNVRIYRAANNAGAGVYT